jgi:hypothetical protein
MGFFMTKTLTLMVAIPSLLATQEVFKNFNEGMMKRTC